MTELNKIVRAHLKHSRRSLKPIAEFIKNTQSSLKAFQNSLRVDQHRWLIVPPIVPPLPHLGGHWEDSWGTVGHRSQSWRTQGIGSIERQGVLPCSHSSLTGATYYPFASNWPRFIEHEIELASCTLEDERDLKVLSMGSENAPNEL